MSAPARTLTADEQRVVGAFTAEVHRTLGDRVARIVLFGSRARGDHHRDSDYDLIVLLRDPTPAARQMVRDAAVEISTRYPALVVALAHGESEFTEDRLFYLYHEILRDGREV